MKNYIQLEDWVEEANLKVKVRVIDYLKCTIENYENELVINYGGMQ